MDIVSSVVQVMMIMGLPAAALLGIGIWAFRRDSRAPVRAVAILLIALGAALGLFTLAVLLLGVGVTTSSERFERLGSDETGWENMASAGVQAEGAGGAAEMPDVPAPKIGDAPNEAEMEDLRFIARQEGISVQEAIERYGWQDNFSLAVAQIEEAIPHAFAGAEIVDDSSAWVAFNADAPQAARDIINTFRSSHRGVSVQIRANAGISEEELSEAIPIVHYAIYRSPEVRDAGTSFNSETGQIESVVVLERGVPDSAIEELTALAEAKLIEETRADILDSVGVRVVQLEREVITILEGNR